MIDIRYAEAADEAFWRRLDRHLPADGFSEKVRTETAYVLTLDGEPIGLMRYNLFWDSIPFCTLLYIDPAHQRQGYGRRLMAHWEADMRARGYDMVLTSTQSDEEAQHFYRALGYKDCGGLLIDLPGHAQPTELFLVKAIGVPVGEPDCFK